MSNEPSKPAGKVVHPRLDPELHARLVAWASRERRSLNQAVALLLERALDTDDAQQ